MAWLFGYPRDKVNWYPTIVEEKCVSCGMCMNCGKKVYEWVDGKPKVVRPNECVVGCSTCANLCQGSAIRFPRVKEIRTLYEQNKIWDAVKKDLIEKGVIPKQGG
jgi:NAD-dependent dihydropyrimidine dehydrogenase PreA subunit